MIVKYVKTLRTAKLLFICVLVSLILSLFIALLPITASNTFRDNFHNIQLQNDEYRLAIIVPFRDRFEELLSFVPHIHRFISAQNISHEIFVINQSDNLRFNRASLINVGFLLVNQQFDYIAMHDVDLLPLNPQLSYAFPKNGPFHIASPELHPKYHYKTFVGGILLISNEHFQRVNGMSNRYWGWGLEDDEFYARLTQANLNITRPQDVTTGINDTFLHIHKVFRKRDTAKLYNQKEVTRRRDRETGLHNVDYELLSKHRLQIDGSECTVICVKLKCNVKTTPWCVHKQIRKKT
ncbi:beta-1:4-galactosyltransferase 7-like isoform X2 [Leptotrombidium deliense]|uniref:Beta-1,4-galactosyltransferase 7 n=1 Tax=Leptotrombidium deliense TaxID=299467 RepID=A0A443SQU6_9ACAR|nr:beta-1:4-galactosyltransferase 7-like isoform X2 [Leptotrombidium deliense]